MEKLQWSALEYDYKEHSADWFWALGVIVITGSIASIIFGNYFFAILLILSGILLGFFAIKKPDMIYYELNEKGFKAGSRLYPYQNIKAFWVQRELNGEIKIMPALFIKSERAFMPIISAPIENNSGPQIRSIMLAENIPEEEMKEHASEKIMEYFGF